MESKDTDVNNLEEESSGASMTIEPTPETDGMFATTDLGIPDSSADVKDAGDDDLSKGAGKEQRPGDERIRQLNEDKKTAEADALHWKTIATQNAQQAQGKKPDKEELDFKKIEDMSADEVREWREENPVEFEENQRKRNLYETRQAQEAQTTSATIKRTFDAYGEKNEDFTTMWKDGSLSKFMAENPGHNAISAHLTLTFDARVEKAVEKARKTWEKESRARGSAKGLGAGPGAAPHVPGGNDDAALKNPEKYGGESAVLLSRLRARQSASARK